jgi:hypothetical protein
MSLQMYQSQTLRMPLCPTNQSLRACLIPLHNSNLWLLLILVALPQRPRNRYVKENCYQDVSNSIARLKMLLQSSEAGRTQQLRMRKCHRNIRTDGPRTIKMDRLVHQTPESCRRTQTITFPQQQWQVTANWSPRAPPTPIKNTGNGTTRLIFVPSLIVMVKPVVMVSFDELTSRGTIPR